MKKADESKNEDYRLQMRGEYWLKNRSDKNLRIFELVIAAPIALILGIIVMIDYCNEDK